MIVTSDINFVILLWQTGLIQILIFNLSVNRNVNVQNAIDR